MIHTITKEEIVDMCWEFFYDEKFVNNIIETRKICSHGSTLEESYELFESFEEDYKNPLEDDEELKAFLYHWLPLRFNYIANEIIDELKYYKEIHREIMLDFNDIQLLREREYQTIQVHKVGVYWSTSPYTKAQNGDHDGKMPITIKIPYDERVVDWYGTLESRLDYLHGDQEQEIKLNPNSYIEYELVDQKLSLKKNKNPFEVIDCPW